MINQGIRVINKDEQECLVSRYEDDINPSKYINSLKYPDSSKYSQKFSISVATEQIDQNVL